MNNICKKFCRSWSHTCIAKSNGISTKKLLLVHPKKLDAKRKNRKKERQLKALSINTITQRKLLLNLFKTTKTLDRR